MFVWPQKILLLKSDIATAPLLFPSQSIDDDTELLNVELRRQILNYSFVGWIILGVGYLFCCWINKSAKANCATKRPEVQKELKEKQKWSIIKSPNHFKKYSLLIITKALEPKRLRQDLTAASAWGCFLSIRGDSTNTLRVTKAW